MKAATSTSGSITLTVVTASADATLALGARVGALCEGGEVLALTGPLGAGKTWLAKGVASGVGIPARDVTSPTYLLIHELEGRLPFKHLDAYRVSSSEVLDELGARDFFDGTAVVLIEWAGHVESLLPPDRLDIVIDYLGETDRTLTLTATGPRHGRIVEALRDPSTGEGPA